MARQSQSAQRNMRLEKALNALREVHEQSLQTLAQRNDFPPFVTKEIQKELESFRQERIQWKSINEPNTSKQPGR